MLTTSYWSPGRAIELGFFGRFGVDHKSVQRNEKALVEEKVITKTENEVNRVRAADKSKQVTAKILELTFPVMVSLVSYRVGTIVKETDLNNASATRPCVSQTHHQAHSHFADHHQNKQRSLQPVSGSPIGFSAKAPPPQVEKLGTRSSRRADREYREGCSCPFSFSFIVATFGKTVLRVTAVGAKRRIQVLRMFTLLNMKEEPITNTHNR